MNSKVKPKISVIVPAYNAQKTIKKCLNSLLQQTIPCYIIVINDGSTDQTEKILKDYFDVSQVTIITNSNSGVSASRNLGLSEVKTEYVTFVDADDYVNNNYLRDLYENINHPLVDMSICSWETVGITKKRFIQKDGMFSASQVMKSIFSESGPKGYLWNKLFKTGIILQEQIKFDEKIKIAEDMLFCCEYLMHSNKVRVSSEINYNYLLSSNSVSSNFCFENKDLEFYRNYLDALNEIIKNIPSDKRGLLTEVEANICNICCDMIRIVNLYRLSYNTCNFKKKAMLNSRFLKKSSYIGKKRIVIYYLTIYFPALMRFLDVLKYSE